MSQLKKIFILTGPTSCGKTEIAIKIAQKIPDIEFISADSRQIYLNMDIGTDKPVKEILKKYKHHCIDIIEPDVDFDVKQYIDYAQKCIFDILSRGKKPLIVGGTGLYIKSFIKPLFVGPGKNKQIRNKIYEIAIEKGNAFLFEKLKKYDSEYANKINVNDTRRLVRALEVYHLTGKPISYFHNHKTEDNRKLKSNYKYSIICLYRNRENIYKRINNRVDQMIISGLIQETEKLMKKYSNINLNAMQSLGYKQIISYLQEKISQEEAIELIKKETRHFAKRQLSWFRNQIKIDYWINLDEYESIELCLKKIISLMRKEGY